MTAVPKAMLRVRAIRLAKNIIGEGIGSVVAEKCSPSHSSSKPSWSASRDFSVSSSSVLQNVRSGGCTGIMNIPRRMRSSPNLMPYSRGHAACFDLHQDRMHLAVLFEVEQLVRPAG